MHVYTHIHMHVQLYISMHACVDVCMYPHMLTCVHVYISAHAFKIQFSISYTETHDLVAIKRFKVWSSYHTHVSLHWSLHKPSYALESSTAQIQAYHQHRWLFKRRETSKHIILVGCVWELLW